MVPAPAILARRPGSPASQGKGLESRASLGLEEKGWDKGVRMVLGEVVREQVPEQS